MDKEEIKLACEAEYEAIRNSEEKLKALRLLCKHEDTFIGNYSWRIGCIDKAEICSHCNQFIKYTYP